MRGIAQRMQKKDGLSLPAPIQIVKLDAVDCDESSLVWRLVHPVGLGIDMKGEHHRHQHSPESCLLRNHARGRDV